MKHKSKHKCSFWIQILAVLLNGCRTLGRSLNFGFLTEKHGLLIIIEIIIINFIRLLEE